MHYRYILTLALIILTYSFSMAESIPSSFKEYSEINLPDGGTVFIAPGIKYIVNESKEDDFISKAIDVSIKSIIISISFDNGPSADPTYYFTVNRDDKNSTQIYADRVFISNSGSIYADGWSDQFFYLRRKFTVEGKTIKEVKQPFYLVNKRCRSNGDMTLTTEPCGRGDIVASLPDGTVVDALAAKNYEFEGDCKGMINVLVSTPFGLVGWTKNWPGTLLSEGSPLSCIQYRGD